MTRATSATPSDLGGNQIEATLQLLEGKWKGVILYFLLREEVLRFNEITKRLPSITHRMLSKQLRDLEVAGLVARTVYPVVPPRVDYSLTRSGAASSRCCLRSVAGGRRTSSLWRTPETYRQKARSAAPP